MEVVVANPRKLKYITQDHRKSDVRDAQALAKFVRLDRELLHPIKHRSEESQKSLLMIKMRDVLVRNRVSKIVALRGMFKSLGLRFPSCSTAYFTKKAEQYIQDEHPEFEPVVAPYLVSIEQDTDQIKEYEAQLHNAIAQDHPEALLLQTIPCVGALTALCYVLTIEDVNRFDNVRDVGAFLGLKYMTSGGKAAKKKAIIAVARKLAVTMLTMLKTGKEYEPYPNGKPKLKIEKKVG